MKIVPQERNESRCIKLKDICPAEEQKGRRTEDDNSLQSLIRQWCRHYSSRHYPLNKSWNLLGTTLQLSQQTKIGGFQENERWRQCNLQIVEIFQGVVELTSLHCWNNYTNEQKEMSWFLETAPQYVSESPKPGSAATNACRAFTAKLFYEILGLNTTNVGALLQWSYWLLKASRNPEPIHTLHKATQASGSQTPAANNCFH